MAPNCTFPSVRRAVGLLICPTPGQKVNVEGYVKSDNVRHAGITSELRPTGNSLINLQCRLPNDRAHTLKAWGSYQFNNGLRIAPIC